MKEKSHNQTSKKAQVTGSINHAELRGDYYSIGMSLMNVLTAIVDQFGESGVNMINEALNLAKINKGFFTIKDSKLRHLRQKLQDEDKS